MRILVLLFFLLPALELHSQTAEDSVRQVIINFFSAMKSSDTARMRTVLSPTIHMEATQTRPNATPVLAQVSVTDFLGSVARTPAGALDERIEFEVVKTDGPLAIVWTPYQFYFNGRYSHCGVNSFQLIRQQGKWQIQYLIDTRRKECSPAN
ncbi:MAG: nuclear transport factor 2 family protein [Bacteroidetes bacterium]|nr:nuclear transport factor 2 family protein [Bacteroidota bacterium]